MILFMILLTMILTLTLITILAISAGGVAFIIIFGDVIVCIILLSWLVYRLYSRKK